MTAPMLRKWSTYCDRDGIKIEVGDTIQFYNSSQKCSWTGEVSFEDGVYTVDTLSLKQVFNPTDWDKPYDWIKSRWCGVEIGYGEFGSWNDARNSLIKIAGYFKSSDEYFKAQEYFKKEYNIEFLHNTEFTRPLPCKIIKKGKE